MNDIQLVAKIWVCVHTHCCRRLQVLWYLTRMLLTSNRTMNPATEMARELSTKNARIFSCPEVSNSKRSTLQHTTPVNVRTRFISAWHSQSWAATSGLHCPIGPSSLPALGRLQLRISWQLFGRATVKLREMF